MKILLCPAAARKKTLANSSVDPCRCPYTHRPVINVVYCQFSTLTEVAARRGQQKPQVGEFNHVVCIHQLLSAAAAATAKPAARGGIRTRQCRQILRTPPVVESRCGIRTQSVRILSNSRRRPHSKLSLSRMPGD